MTTDAARRVEQALGHRFVRPEHLTRALTHRSVASAGNNETLEFLGDAVLDLAVSDLLMRRFPDAPEGDLSKMRAGLVNASSLARKAETVGLGEALVLGKGEEMSGGRTKDSILAAAYEAVLGAIYLDAGYDAARTVAERHFATDLDSVADPGAADFKTRLQEETQRTLQVSPVYTLVGERGPDHDKRFVAELSIGGEVYGRGTGTTKKAAEQAAAREALERLDDETRTPKP